MPTLFHESPRSLVLLVDHEDTYAHDLEKNRCGLARIFSSLGATIPENDLVNDVLDPGKPKTTGTQVYKRIPNALDIEDRYGCENTGRLFEEP